MNDIEAVPILHAPTDHPVGWPHCPDCRCVPLGHEAFCWLCGAGICSDLTDCEDEGLGEFCPEPAGCDACAGTGAADPRAWATGHETSFCFECGGHGYVGRSRTPSTTAEPCAACRGTGETEGLGGHPGRCWECRGTGEVERDE